MAGDIEGIAEKACLPPLNILFLRLIICIPPFRLRPPNVVYMQNSPLLGHGLESC